MTQVFEIPLVPSTNQRFNIVINTLVYNMNVYWDWCGGNWNLDLLDQNQTPLVQGVALLPGTTPLLDQYSYLGLNFDLNVQTDNDTFAVPTFDNLGVTSHLYCLVA
jgi:hypothetical protein